MALQYSRFDIQEIYQSTFGKAYRFLPVPGLALPERFAQADGELEEGNSPITQFKQALLQMPDQPLKTYTSLEGIAIFMPCKIDGIQLPNEPTIEIEGSKSIVKTQVAGRDGDVKENMGRNDWKVTIRGLAINNSSDGYPMATVKQLRDLDAKKTALKIDNWLCNLFGIKQIVIEDIQIPDMMGHQNCQPYRFNCVSDEPITLKLRNLKNRK